MVEDIWQQMYSRDAAAYERIVQNEDYQGGLLQALQAICNLKDIRAAEMGAGTGRITALLAPHVRFIAAFDIAPLMLAQAQVNLRRMAGENWNRNDGSNFGLALGDNRCLPAASGWADLVVEGWSFLHLKVWYSATWIDETDRALKEMLRLARPGGIAVVIETLGTGVNTPAPAPDFLPFFERLETEWGFEHRWARTDYRFASQEQARQALLPAFGEAVLAALEHKTDGWVLPECTGLWWRMAVK